MRVKVLRNDWLDFTMALLVPCPLDGQMKSSAFVDDLDLSHSVYACT